MNSLLLNGRMALMRKMSCLLTILFCLIATVFLLIYPVFMEDTRAELEYAYDTIEVSGWLFNNRNYNEPRIEGEVWHALMDTGCIGESYAYSTVEIKIIDKYLITSTIVGDHDEANLALAFKRWAKRLANTDDYKAVKNAQGINSVHANDELGRMESEIRWMDGWSSEAFSHSAEPVCLLPKGTDWELGDLVPFQMRNMENEFAIVCLRVVGYYSGVDKVKLFMPIHTMEALCQAQTEGDWAFWLNGFSFLIRDNRELPRFKRILVDLQLAGGSTGRNVQAAIDDRILDGTISPIKNNLSMLEGLYRLFFVVVAAIGFFLCFLLTKGRRQEYAVMRLLGESSFRVAWKAILEQLLLCLLGIVIGAVLLLIVGQGAPDLATCGIILVCYTLGAAMAVILTVRVNVMEILRDQE